MAAASGARDKVVMTLIVKLTVSDNVTSHRPCLLAVIFASLKPSHCVNINTDGNEGIWLAESMQTVINVLFQG